MPGIQTRGRGRTTTNKIEQIKTQNKVVVSQSGQSTIKYKPIPASGQLDQSTQNQIQPTASNIEQSQIVKKAKTRRVVVSQSGKSIIKYKPKQINTQGLTPLGKIGLGIYNTGSDYANILNTDYEDKSVLNQAIGHALEGKWDKAGQVIQNNPYRFAGNLAVEVGSALIPLGWVLRGAKVGSTLGKVARKIKPNKGGVELKEFYAGGQYTQKEITSVEKLVKEQGGGKKFTQNDFDRLMDSTPEPKDIVKRDIFGKEMNSGLSPEEISKLNKIAKEKVKKPTTMTARERDELFQVGPIRLPPNFVRDEFKAVRSKLVAQTKVGGIPKKLSVTQKKIIKNKTETAAINFEIAFDKKISPSGRKLLKKGFKKEEYDSLKKYKHKSKSPFEKNQIRRESGPNEPNLGALKDGRFRKSLGYGKSDREIDNIFEQSYDPDMAKKWTGLGLGLGGAGVIGGVGLSETDSKKNKDRSLGGYGEFL